MNPTRLQKEVERRLLRIGLDLGRLDVLVMSGEVNLTGQFIFRQTHKPVLSDDLRILKQSLFRIPGIQAVYCRNVDNPVFV